ncbi:MAG: hypothetical protein Q8M01_22625 [Rubrivivax sp.]|nr:hypothetical protein [Rubrivivax sp.]
MDAPHHGAVPGLAAPELAHHGHVDLAPLGTAAAHAVVTATTERAPDAANVGGPAKTETRCLILEQQADGGKRYATLRAHFAVKDYSLHRTAASDGKVRFNITRWGLVRELRDIAAVRVFAEQVGATHA